MKQLSWQTKQQLLDEVIENGRELEAMKARNMKGEQTGEDILIALRRFQNDDGGFGNGLEADFRLPDSSALATSVAFQTLIQWEEHPLALPIIERSITYLEDHFDEARRGWYAVPPKVNDYPHAFWWHVHEDGRSFIDHHWGNPSAELIGYLYQYRSFTRRLNVDQLVKDALEHLDGLEKFESEHEIYCYQRLFKLHPDLETPRLADKITHAVQELVHEDQTKWKEYVPQPLSFVHHPDEQDYDISHEAIETNLDMLVDVLKDGKLREPNWAWGDHYPDAWQAAKQEWEGVLTLEALTLLDHFNRIDSPKL
ncbi:hypothetical protein [Thalassobacillus sp. CUG 92003]|uniref:hypothetical protein n=1 Tax=Thalassobacillus sp. CUG 92003 TaxID=2736641 RepID=UPI0015E71B4D|nr:hypothetical protein [Thalassobacillus sp. CUG 92003]